MIDFSTKKIISLENITIGINGTIQKTKKTYSYNMVNYNALIEDYLNIMQYDSSQAANPWVHITRKVTGISPYTGCTASETAFIFGAMTLKKQRPTDVINSLLFANNVRNDSMLEYSLVFKEFIQNILPEERILIVNPCPIIIEHLESHEPDIAKNTIYAIPNERIAALFNGQYKCSRFISTYVLSSCGKFQHIHNRS